MKPGYCPINFPFQQSGLESGCCDWLLGTSWTWKSMLRVTAPCAKCTNAYLKTSHVGLSWGCPKQQSERTGRQALCPDIRCQRICICLFLQGLGIEAFLSKYHAHHSVPTVIMGYSLPAICYHHHKASFVPPNTFPGGNEIQMKVTVIVISGPIKLCFPVFCNEEEIGSDQ